MPKLLLHTAVFLLFASTAIIAGGTSSNDYVKVDVRPPSTALKPGGSGEVEFRFIPVDGIHINVDPPVTFTLDTMTVVSLKEKPVMTKDAKTGYLSTSSPVRQTVVLARNAAPGTFTVKGTVSYFFCSETEGWCNRQKQPVEFTIVVKP